MFLKRIELQGFKSFADRTVLEFKQGITAVIGPNGSGKSNISDAIRWVLGEQSMKALRGAKSEDIIFAGTQARKSVGFAEVSIVLDNTDNSLPIEYQEVIVTRKIYRSGETGYFINKTPCRLKDILQLFMDTGIGKDGYSIIGQGKIDEILSNKSEDRRHIFEEAAGIIKYRSRREESEKKLEQTKVNLIRINDILTEIEANLEPLQIQSEKAKKFLELHEELKSIEVGLYLYKIDNLKQKLEELIKDKEIFEDQSVQENSKLDEMQSLKEQLKTELEAVNEQIEKMQTLGFESKNKIEKINSDINVSKERIQNNKENKNRLENEITEAEQNIINFEEEKQSREVRKEDLIKNREKFAKELEEKEKELSVITEKLTKKELEIEKKKAQIEKLTEDRYEYKNDITENETNQENTDERIKQEKKELVKIISELDKLRNEKNELQKGYSKIEAERNTKKQNLEKVQNKQAEIDRKTQDFERMIVNLTDEKRMKTSKLNFLIETEREKEGYGKSVKDLLLACESDSGLKKGVNGVLANIISTDDKYQTAIEMALGASIQNIVTDTEQDAKKMIEYLRKNNLGRASFLPISSVKGNKLGKISEVPGVIGIASDLVKYDKKYDGIVQNLLGRTIITENIEASIKLAKANKYSFKIVSIEGDIINPSGAMSGGSVAKKSFSLLGRKAEIKSLEKKIKDIDKKLEKIVTEKEEFLKQNESIIKEIEELTNDLQKSEIEFATENEKMNSIEKQIEKVIANKEKTEQDIHNFEENVEKLKQDKQDIENKIEEVTKVIDELSKEVEEYANLNKEDQEYIDNLNNDITNLKISVSSFDESNLSMEEMLERINQDIETEKKSIENKKAEIEKAAKQNEELNELIIELEASIEKIKQDVENSGTKSEELKQTRNEKNLKLDKVEKELTSQFEVIQNVKSQLVKIDLKQGTLSQDIEETINDLWNDYEITPNNAGEFKKPDNVQETQKKVNQIHSKIKELGSVNVDAIEEYKKTKERYEVMSEQRLDLETTMSKLRDVIQEMTKTMKEQFAKKFVEINKNFNEVFVQLFGGGKAELVLEDKENILECGIDIQAQPTGKKLQNMMLLSGGEKALTAIALLFAILKINPAPFCILDEIEAALDDVNVYRYAEFLKQFSINTQFLIITHRKGTMEAANTVYGVTMEENGISKLLSISLSDSEK